MSDERRGATSASNAAADLLCPGRHLAQRGLPERAGPYAESGRAVHAVLAGKTIPLDAAQQKVLADCQAIELRLVDEFFGHEPGRMVPKVWREQRYWAKVPGPDGKPVEHSGQPDVVYRAGKRALILEYKTLYGDVPESPENLQLRDQAVLVRGNLLVPEIGVAVIQPAVSFESPICLYDKATLDRAEAEMFQRVLASNDPKSPRRAGDLQCAFCLAKRHCAEYQRFAGSTVPGMVTILDVPVSAWTPEQRAIFCDRKGTAQKWLDECESAIKDELAKDENAVPGWYLKDGSERETISKPQTVFERFLAQGGTQENYLKCVTVGKTRLRDEVAAATSAKGKALNQVMDALLDGCVETTKTAKSLQRKETK